MEEVSENSMVTDESDTNVIKEGKSRIIKTNDVFYNKAQEFNRDLRYVQVLLGQKLTSSLFVSVFSQCIRL